MPSYCCYVLGEQDQIDDVLQIKARTLAAAVDKGLSLLAPHPDHSIEIWRGEETLYRSPPPGSLARQAAVKIAPIKLPLRHISSFRGREIAVGIAGSKTRRGGL